MKKRVIFLFGAGASAFSGDCFPYAPPLGKDLFAKMWDVGYVPANLPDHVRAKFESDSDFERGMEVLSSDSTYYMPFLRSMARFFARFLPGKGNLFVKLFAQLINNYVLFCVATLNYENLIDHALRQASATGGTVLKPHGSCGFLPDFGIHTVANNVFHDNFGEMSDIESNNTRVVIDPNEIERWCLDPANASYAPAMSFYAPGKVTKVNPGLIKVHRAAW